MRRFGRRSQNFGINFENCCTHFELIQLFRNKCFAKFTNLNLNKNVNELSETVIEINAVPDSDADRFQNYLILVSRQRKLNIKKYRSSV